MSDEREPYPWNELVYKNVGSWHLCSVPFCRQKAVSIERIEVKGPTRPDVLGRLYSRCAGHTKKREERR